MLVLSTPHKLRKWIPQISSMLKKEHTIRVVIPFTLGVNNMTKLINERVLRVTGSMIIIVRHMTQGTEYILKENNTTNGILFRCKRDVRDYIGAAV